VVSSRINLLHLSLTLGRRFAASRMGSSSRERPSTAGAGRGRTCHRKSSHKVGTDRVRPQSLYFSSGTKEGRRRPASALIQYRTCLCFCSTLLVSSVSWYRWVIADCAELSPRRTFRQLNWARPRPSHHAEQRHTTIALGHNARVSVQATAVFSSHPRELTRVWNAPAFLTQTLHSESGIPQYAGAGKSFGFV